MPVTDDITVSDRQDFILVDTTSKNIIVTLPVAKNGREIEVMKDAEANYVSIVPTSPETILGETEVRVYNYGTSLRFKAVNGRWVII